MYVVFHSNFAACIVFRRYQPCEFLGFVWTDYCGNKSNYVITSPANCLRCEMTQSAIFSEIVLKALFIVIIGFHNFTNKFYVYQSNFNLNRTKS